jgi:HSP20 family protein
MLKMNSLFPVSRYGTHLNLFDDMFNTMLGLPMQGSSFEEKSNNSATVPRANILKDEKGYSIELAVPGFSRSDFNIEINNNILTVSSEVEITSEYKQNLSAQEYSYNTFSRSWTLPSNVYMKGIDARYESGILSVEVPVESGDAGFIQIDVK